MTMVEWLVVLTGALAIGAVNWWFFVAGRESRAATVSTSGRQEVTITVNGGYAPNRVRLQAGRPVRLIFDRQEAAGCSEEVVFPALGLRRFLPPFEKTTVDLAPQAAGRYEFTCGMSMLRGSLEVE